MKFTILGGGISGLSAAHYLSKFTASEKVKVFEKVLNCEQSQLQLFVLSFHTLILQHIGLNVILLIQCCRDSSIIAKDFGGKIGIRTVDFRLSILYSLGNQAVALASGRPSSLTGLTMWPSYYFIRLMTMATIVSPLNNPCMNYEPRQPHGTFDARFSYWQTSCFLFRLWFSRLQTDLAAGSLLLGKPRSSSL